MIDEREYELEILKQEERSDADFVVLVIALLAAAGGAAFMLAMIAMLLLLAVLNAPAPFLQSQTPALIAVVTATPTLPSPPTAEAFAPVVVITLTATPLPAETLAVTEVPTLPAADTPAFTPTPTLADAFGAPPTAAPPLDATPYAPPPVAPPSAAEVDLAPLLVNTLGPSNRNVTRVTRAAQVRDVANVEWAINSAVSNELLNDGARMDVIHMLIALRNSGTAFNTINFTGTFPALDAAGNQIESSAVTLTYTREALDTIDWANQAYVDNELKNTIFGLATNAQLAPAFQGQ